MTWADDDLREAERADEQDRLSRRRGGRMIRRWVVMPDRSVRTYYGGLAVSHAVVVQVAGRWMVYRWATSERIARRAAERAAFDEVRIVPATVQEPHVG